MARKAVKKTTPLSSKRGATSTDVIIGNRVRARRMEMHMSQEELGKHLGVSFQQVQKYEKGVNRVGAGRLHQIAGVLDTDVMYFMGDISNGKARGPSPVATFMATHDGLNIIEAMMKISNDEHRKAVISLARRLGDE